jgi:tetratricopeptide (TPR) repeat protein
MNQITECSVEDKVKRLAIKANILPDEVIVMPDMQGAASANVPPENVVERILELGADTIMYRCYFMKTHLVSYFESFLEHLDNDKRLNVVIDLKDSWWINKSYPYTSAAEFKSLCNRHTSINGIIYDDFMPNSEMFSWVKEIQLRKLAVVYSKPELGQVPKMQNALKSADERIDALIDYYDAWDAKTPMEYCGREDFCNFAEKDYANGIAKWRNSFHDKKHYAGFHCFADDFIRVSNEQLERFMFDALLQRPDGYMFWLLDWGEGYESWHTEMKAPNDIHKSKYGLVKEFISYVKGKHSNPSQFLNKGYYNMINAGQELYNNHDYQAALLYFKTATLMIPSYAIGFTKLGDTFTCLRETNAAMESFRKAHAIEPNDEYVGSKVRK